MKKNYNSELEAMQDFWDELGIIPDYSCNTDGRERGTLVEFKLNFTDLNNHKKQCNRYIEAFNATANPIPEHCLLVDINNREYIEGNLKTGSWSALKKWSKPQDFIAHLQRDNYIKGWIDEKSIISYSNKVCKDHPKIFKSKEDVKKEFINPQYLNIKLFDWDGHLTQSWFRFNMNMLGPDTLKKQLGAFFTPDEYVKISTQYVRNAIANVPEGQDYVILDRCAGTGNLEKFFTEEELSHCILNTIDYTEWCTLRGIYEGRVREIIPHDNLLTGQMTFEQSVQEIGLEENGLMSKGDALQKDFYDYLEEKELLKDKYVIMLENPPFGEPQAGANQGKQTASAGKKSFVLSQMKLKFGGVASNDLANQFIWSAKEFINPDEYILYSPIKYWKSQGVLVDYNFIEGHCCNRKNFNATESNITLIHWQNQVATKSGSINLTTDSNECMEIKQVNKLLSERLPLVANKGIGELGCIIDFSYVPDFKNGQLSNIPRSVDSRERSLDRNNVLELLPIHCANQYKPEVYYKKDTVYKTNDMDGVYLSDIKFLQNCLLWSCFVNKHISDSTVTNELCLSQNSLADDLLEDHNHNLVILWNEILTEAKTKTEFSVSWRYGLYQIEQDINVKKVVGHTKTGGEIKAPKYIMLDEKIKNFKSELKDFYKKEIEPKLFEYELLK